jgi:hypothetical protein
MSGLVRVGSPSSVEGLIGEGAEAAGSGLVRANFARAGKASRFRLDAASAFEVAFSVP